MHCQNALRPIRQASAPCLPDNALSLWQPKIRYFAVATDAATAASVSLNTPLRSCHAASINLICRRPGGGSLTIISGATSGNR